jgi:hypothetical protein
LALSPARATATSTTEDLARLEEKRRAIMARLEEVRPSAYWRFACLIHMSVAGEGREACSDAGREGCGSTGGCNPQHAAGRHC